MIAGLAIILFITLKHDFMQTANLAPQEISIHAIGNALLSSDKYGYVLPFEAVSILLLACDKQDNGQTGNHSEESG